LTAISDREWTTPDIELLKALCRDHYLPEIAQRLDRSAAAVALKAAQLALPIRVPPAPTAPTVMIEEGVLLQFR